MLWIILLGVALIDGELWKLVLEQRRHNTAVERLLTEMRDRALDPSAGADNPPQS